MIIVRLDTELAQVLRMVQRCDLLWLWVQWCERTPDKVFLIWSSADSGENQWTYAQFNESVRRVAVGLRLKRTMGQITRKT